MAKMTMRTDWVLNIDFSGGNYIMKEIAAAPDTFYLQLSNRYLKLFLFLKTMNYWGIFDWNSEREISCAYSGQENLIAEYNIILSAKDS